MVARISQSSFLCWGERQDRHQETLESVLGRDVVWKLDRPEWSHQAHRRAGQVMHSSTKLEGVQLTMAVTILRSLLAICPTILLVSE